MNLPDFLERSGEIEPSRRAQSAGDEFDVIVKYAKWAALLGDWTYNVLLFMNHYFNAARRAFGFPYWSLSAYIKHKVKNAVEYISQFEGAVASVAKQRGMDGVVCGHIHNAEMRMIDGVLYCNDGDWVESCTALVEHFDGRLELLYWAEAAPDSVLYGARRPRRKQPDPQPAS